MARIAKGGFSMVGFLLSVAIVAAGCSAAENSDLFRFDRRPLASAAFDFGTGRGDRQPKSPIRAAEKSVGENCYFCQRCNKWHCEPGLRLQSGAG